jgi:hypothetical protein
MRLSFNLIKSFIKRFAHNIIEALKNILIKINKFKFWILYRFNNNN